MGSFIITTDESCLGLGDVWEVCWVSGLHGSRDPTEIQESLGRNPMEVAEYRTHQGETESVHVQPHSVRLQIYTKCFQEHGGRYYQVMHRQHLNAPRSKSLALQR